MDETTPLIVNQEKEQQQTGIRDAAVIKNLGLSMVILLSTCASDLGGQAISQYIIAISKNHFISNETETLSVHDVNNTFNSTNACGFNISKTEENQSQKLVAHFNWYNALIERVLTLPAILLAGVYSDQVGRKPLMMFSTIGSFLQYAAYTYLMYKNYSLYFFTIPPIISGIAGLRIPFSLALTAAVSDTTKRNHHRSLAFAILDIFLGMGGFVATVISGYFIRSYGYFWPVVTSTCLYFISIFILQINVKETLKVSASDKRKTSFCNRLFGFFYDSERIKDNPKWKFLLCFLVFVTMELASTASSGIGTLYKMSFPLCWESRKIGWYTASLSFLHSTIGACFLKILQLCTRDDVIIILGFLSAIGYQVCTGLSSHDWELYLAAGIGFFSSMPGTILRALMTIMVDETDQGTFLTSYYLWSNVVAMSGTTVSNNIYAATEPIFKGFVYFISAGVYLVTVLFMLILVASGGVKGKPKATSKVTRKAVNGKPQNETMESCH